MTDELRKRLKQLRSEIASGDTERAARAAPELRSLLDEAQQTQAQAEAEIEKAKQAIVSGEGIGRIAEDVGGLVLIGGAVLLIVVSVWAFSNTWSWVWDVAALLGIALVTYVLSEVVTGSLRFRLLIFAVRRGERRAQPSAIRERRQRAEKRAQVEAKRQERSERLSARIGKIRGFSLEWNTFRLLQRRYLQRELDAQKRHDRETGITRNPPLPTAKELQNMDRGEIKQLFDPPREVKPSVEPDVAAPSPRSEPTSEGSSGGYEALFERIGEDRIDAAIDKYFGSDKDEDE
jgi:hypothetical protein